MSLCQIVLLDEGQTRGVNLVALVQNDRSSSDGRAAASACLISGGPVTQVAGKWASVAQKRNNAPSMCEREALSKAR